ncbi:MAG: LolA-related protein [Pseudomonadota bacterium]
MHRQPEPAGLNWCGVLLLTLALPGGPAAYAAAPVLDEVMGALAARQHGHVTFTEQQFLAVLERPLQSSGELLYDAPDRLEKRTLKPKPESLVLERGVVTVQRGRRKTVLDLREYPQILPFVESIRATLAGDSAALQRVFTVTFTGSFAEWQLALVPLDAKLAATVRQVSLAGSRDEIRSVETLVADGDRSVLTIGAPVAP